MSKSKFKDWEKKNAILKEDLLMHHNADIENIRVDILSIVKILRESENPFDLIKSAKWVLLKESHGIFGSYIDRLIGSLGETDDLDHDRFVSLIVLAKQREMKMDLHEMARDINLVYKNIKMING